MRIGWNFNHLMTLVDSFHFVCRLYRFAAKMFRPATTKSFAIELNRSHFKPVDGENISQDYEVRLDVHIHRDSLQIRNSDFLRTMNCDGPVQEPRIRYSLRSRSNNNNTLAQITSTKTLAKSQSKSTLIAHEQTSNIRNLRSRNNHNIIVKTSTKKTVAKPQSKSISIDQAWRLCKISNKENESKINANEIVMAKLRGYTAWPAVVGEFINKSTAKVEFLGVTQSEKIGFVPIKEITRFSDSQEVIQIILKRQCPKFKKAVQEAEMICGIPSYASITKMSKL